MVKNENNNFCDTVYQVEEYQFVFFESSCRRFFDNFGFGINRHFQNLWDLIGTPSLFRFKFFLDI